MSIFTKIFVVLVMVLAVLLAALVVPNVVNHENYREKWLTVQSQLEVQRYNAANKETEISALHNQIDEVRKSMQQQLGVKEATINNLQTNNQNLEAQVIQLQNANADVRGQLAQLSTGLKQAAEINAMLQSEIKDRRDQMLLLQTRNIELTQSLRDRTTQVDTLVHQVRFHKEQIVDLTSTNDKLQTKVATLEQYAKKADNLPGNLQMTTGSGVPSAVAVRGMVTDVKQIGDEQFVAINVGANDKVVEGMKFMVHRGDQYLGDVVITQVDLNSAAGRVTLKRGDIVPNAEVLAGGL